MYVCLATPTRPMNHYKPKKLKISLVFDKRSYTDIRTYIEIGEAAILINVFCFVFFVKEIHQRTQGSVKMKVYFLGVELILFIFLHVCQVYHET